MKRSPIKRKSKPKPPSKTRLRRECDALARQRYLKEHCEAAGFERVRCGGRLEWCHIETRAVLSMRYQEWNQITMCRGHHQWFTHHGIAWDVFVEDNFPEKWVRVRAAIRQGPVRFEGYEVWKERLR